MVSYITSVVAIDVKEYETKRYAISELGISIELPVQYDVFTRDLTNENPIFTLYGITRDEKRADMISKNVYLDAYDINSNVDITVNMTRNEIFTDVSIEDMYTIIIGQFQENSETSNLELISDELSQQNNVTYLKYEVINKNYEPPAYVVQFSIIYKDMFLNFSMFSFSGEISEDEKILFEDIIKSIEYAEKLRTALKKIVTQVIQ